VLVHQRRAEVPGVHRTPHRLHRGHGRTSAASL
jgi:hypothetical protein